MRTSEQINELAAALAKAQGQFVNPGKNREVKTNTYKFEYADFAAILDAIRKPLADNGLSFVQAMHPSEKGQVLVTRLMHASGQWIENDFAVSVAGTGMQQVGSAQTYARRYALSAMLGVAAEDDDDGNAADGNEAQTRERKPAAKPSERKPPEKTPPPAANLDEFFAAFDAAVESIGLKPALGRKWLNRNLELKKLKLEAITPAGLKSIVDLVPVAKKSGKEPGHKGDLIRFAIRAAAEHANQDNEAAMLAATEWLDAQSMSIDTAEPDAVRQLISDIAHGKLKETPAEAA